jgi:hypothetical protein
MKNGYFLLVLIPVLFNCVKSDANSSPIESNQESSFSDNDWDIDISQYTKAIERFYYNGEEWSRDLYKYLNNELVEYKNWSIEASKNQISRWHHGIVETTEENGNIVTVTKKNRNDDDYQIVGKTIKTKDGKLVSKEEMISWYYEYDNENRLIIWHEKSADGTDRLNIYEFF